jgi:O-antigen ligase
MRALIFLLLLLAAGVDGKGFVFGIDLSKITAVLALCLYIVFRLSLIKGVKYSSGILLAPIMALILTAQGAVISNLSNGWLEETKSWVLGIVYFFILIDIVSGLGRKKLLLVLKTVIIFNIALALSQNIFADPFITERIFEHTFFVGYRASGLMDDPNYFGLYLIIICSFLISVNSINDKVSNYKWLILMIIGVFLSGSRSMLLVSIVLFFINFFAWNRNQSLTEVPITKLALASVAALFIIYYFREYLPSALQMIFEAEYYSIEAERNSLAHRLHSSIFAMENFLNSPVFGLGPRLLQELDTGNSYAGNSHNSYIEILFSYGIFGILVYLLFLRRLYEFACVPWFGNSSTMKFLFLALLISNMFLVNYNLKISFLVYALCVASSFKLRFREKKLIPIQIHT